MNGVSPACVVEERRKKLFGNPDWNGMDFVEVSADQRSLCVHFFGRVPEDITVGNIVIEGGRRVRGIRAVDVRIERAHDEELDDCLSITLDKAGDFSTYRLCLVQGASAPGAAVHGGDEFHGVPRENRKQPMQGLDPRYARLDFNFKVDCPSDLDCKAKEACPPEVFPAPEIDYLTKDYASFRQLIVDRLALTMPDWRERHIPDIGITLVELLAYVADHLSYYQDAVATEAYLDTARHRISVRRHARLVDYRMHEGNNARTWVTVWTATDLPPLKAKDFYFITGFTDIKAGSGNVVKHGELERIPGNLYEVFEPLTTRPDEEFSFRAAHSEMYFYTWGDSECCLPKGATRATLLDQARTVIAPKLEIAPSATVERNLPSLPLTEAQAEPSTATASHGEEKPQRRGRTRHQPKAEKEADTSSHPARASEGEIPGESYNGEPVERAPENPAPQRLLNLRPGDVLIFEEVLGPATNNPADANPLHRHAVRLSKVTPAIDGLLNQLVLEIEWVREDALPFSLCLSSRLPAPDCRRFENVSVARGNIVLVDHGRQVEEQLGPVETERVIHECACEGSVTESSLIASRFNPVLKYAPLTFGEPLNTKGPASSLLAQDPHAALPCIALREFASDDAAATGNLWTPKYDLLGSDSEDRHFVAEMDNDAPAHLRFGNGELGSRPAARVRFEAAYRVGHGPAGNVGGDSLNHLVLRDMALSADAIRPRNPLPAVGGASPEPVAEVKLFAPHAFRTRIERAITAEDYARLSERNSAVQKAAAALRWTGSWYEARVAVDPLYKDGPTGEESDAEESGPAASGLLKEITDYLYPYRRMGHDLIVMPAQHVPLRIGLEVCVLPNYMRGHIKAELLKVFSNRNNLTRGGNRRGFFHPDNLSFGDGIYLSQLIASAKSVEGVETIRVTKLQRFGIPANDALETGVLPLGAMEIAQLDNDPSFPENGSLELMLRGGR
jgi:hypothetical protein